MRVWHYTVGQCLRSILDTLAITPATEGVPPGELPVVWLSAHPLWEPTANKGRKGPNGEIIRLSKEETAAYGEGLYRIEVSPEAAPYSWEDFRRLSGVSSRLAKSLARIARQCGSNYHDWRISFEPITAEKWLSVEIETHTDQWMALPMEVVKAWTRPLLEKGCPVCSSTRQSTGNDWRYMPDPRTEEPRLICAPCFALIQNRASERRTP